MTSSSTVVSFRQPDAVDDPLTGAWCMDQEWGRTNPARVWGQTTRT
jgi:hypothetical protein